MNDFIVYKATIDDLNYIINLQNRNNENIISKDNIKNDLIQNELYFIIEENYTNKIIGYIATNNCYDHLDLISILIDKSYRKKHLASYLLKYLFNYIKNNVEYQNIENIFLEVRKSNFNAIKLYENNNFNYISTRSNYYKNPLEDALIYIHKI